MRIVGNGDVEFDVIPLHRIWPDHAQSGFYPKYLLEGFLEDVRNQYDCIVFDLPPLSGSRVAEPLAAYADCVFLCLAWARQRASLLREALDEHPKLAERLSGVVFTGVRPAKLRRNMRRGSFEAAAIGDRGGPHTRPV